MPTDQRSRAHPAANDLAPLFLLPGHPARRWSLSIGLALPSIATAPLRRDCDRAADRQRRRLCRTGRREAAG